MVVPFAAHVCTGHARTLTAGNRADGVRQNTVNTTELFCATTTPSRTDAIGALLLGCRRQQHPVTDIVGTDNDGERSTQHDSGVSNRPEESQ